MKWSDAQKTTHEHSNKNQIRRHVSKYKEHNLHQMYYLIQF